MAAQDSQARDNAEYGIEWWHHRGRHYRGRPGRL